MDRARIAAAVISLGLVAVTLWPVTKDPRDDGFPLSTYPMFASKRPTVQTYRYALGETAAGERRILSPRMIGTGEVLQALRILQRATGGGQGESVRLCDAIAARVAGADEFRDVVAIRLVRGTHDAVEYLARDRVGREVELVRCEVTR